MKKIFALCLALILILNLNACTPQETIDGREYDIIKSNFIIVKEYEHGTYLVAAKDTNVIYFIDRYGDEGFMSPYLICEDGAIYGSMWIDEEIVPVPFATN